VQVTTAEVIDRKGALQAIGRCKAGLGRVQTVLTDSGYTSKPFAQGVQEALGEHVTVQVAKRSELHKFAVIPKRWVVERSFAWLEKCFESGLLDRLPAGMTTDLTLVGADGAQSNRPKINDAPGMHAYGSEQGAVLALSGAQHPMSGGLSEAMVRFAACHEYARTIKDVLARRSRLLFLDARLAASLAVEVERILQEEIVVDPQIENLPSWP
jgi:transposase